MKLLPCLNCGKYAQEEPVIAWAPDIGTGTIAVCVHCPVCFKRGEVFYTPSTNYSANSMDSQNQATQSAVDDWNYQNKKLRWREVKAE